MNSLEIIGKYVEGEELYELQLKNQEEDTSGRETGNIRTEQIRTGEGIFAEGVNPMDEYLAETLNQIPNPERNGLVLYLADQLLGILSGEESKFLTVVQFLHSVPPGWKVVLPKQKPSGSDGFGVFEQSQYEQVQRFISETMISGIKKFKEKHSSQDYIDFQNLALNLYVAQKEITNARLRLQPS